MLAGAQSAAAQGRWPNFAPVQYFNIGSSPQSLTTGDFNRDGNLDLATANENSNTSLFYSVMGRAASRRRRIMVWA